MSSSASGDAHGRDDSVRKLDVTGYAGLTESPTLEVEPATEGITVDVERQGEEIALAVDAIAPGDVRVRSTGTLTPAEAREVRAALGAALGGVES